jgi:hypothetical protein
MVTISTSYCAKLQELVQYVVARFVWRAMTSLDDGVALLESVWQGDSLDESKVR